MMGSRPGGVPTRCPAMSVSILAIVLLVAGVVILFKTVRMVPQGWEWTVERFGRYTETLSPGLHFLVPIVYGVGRKVNMMEQVLELPSQIGSGSCRGRVCSYV